MLVSGRRLARSRMAHRRETIFISTFPPFVGLSLLSHTAQFLQIFIHIPHYHIYHWLIYLSIILNVFDLLVHDHPYLFSVFWLYLRSNSVCFITHNPALLLSVPPVINIPLQHVMLSFLLSFPSQLPYLCVRLCISWPNRHRLFLRHNNERGRPQYVRYSLPLQMSRPCVPFPF